MHNANERRRYARRQRGGAAVLAIGAMALSLVFVLMIARLADSARSSSSRQARQTELKALADAGLQFGYWQYAWQQASLPYTVANRAYGSGTFTVNVTDYSATISNSIQVVSTATIGNVSLTLTKVFPNNKLNNIIAIDPTSTFLMHLRYGATDAVPIDLDELGIQPGDSIKLRILGSWKSLNATSDSKQTIFVFSKTKNILLPSERYRIPDAIDCTNGGEYASLAAQPGSLATDIPEDFTTSSEITVTVPNQAKYLFAGVDDDWFYENGSPNRDYAVEVTKL